MQLDRLDRTPDGVRLIDYKTGQPTKAKTEPKDTDLQLGLYAMVARHELEHSHGHEGELPGTAEYWVLASGQRGVIGLDRLAKKEAKIREVIDEVIDGMLAGEWPKGSGCRGHCELFA